MESSLKPSKSSFLGTHHLNPFPGDPATWLQNWWNALRVRLKPCIVSRTSWRVGLISEDQGGGGPGANTLPLNCFGLQYVIERSWNALSPDWAPPSCTCTWLMSSQKAWRVCNEAFLMEKCIVDKSILLPKQSFIKAVIWLFTIKCQSTRIS